MVTQIRHLGVGGARWSSGRHGWIVFCVHLSYLLNNQPAGWDNERVAQGATRGRGEVMRQQAGAASWREGGTNVKRYLINYPHLSEANNILSFFSVEGQSNRTRAIWTILLHRTCSLSTQNNFRGRNQIRLDPVQQFCNSFGVQHKMAGDDYPFILQCLVYCKKGTVHHWGILTHP